MVTLKQIRHKVSSYFSTLDNAGSPHLANAAHAFYLKSWCSGKSTPNQSGSNPESDAKCGLSLLLVLSVAPREFSSEVAPAKNLSLPFEY